MNATPTGRRGAGRRPSAVAARLLRGAPLLAWLLLVASCGGGPSPSPDPAARYRELSAARCYAALAERGAAFTPLAAVGEGACAVPAPVSLWRLTAAGFERPLVTGCATALALHDLEIRAIQPLALRHLGAPVTRLHHYGSHACRRMRGGGSWSLHARGLAVDVAAFELADGRVVRVEDGWRDRRRPAGGFLHGVARAACDLFGVTLTPNHDRAHRDHLHLDVGPAWHCGY